MNIKAILVLLGNIMLTHSKITNFFPGTNGNLTKITWAHAINNNTLLKHALASNVMMIEADIVIGKIIGDSSGNLIPIMGHPPADTSDLSLESFLSITHEYNKKVSNKDAMKGIKLDFKSTNAFLQSVDILKPIYNDIQYPIWLNADILQGPVSAKPPTVSAKEFVLGSQPFPNCVLSIGWTTNFDESKPNNSYTKSHVDSMIKFIADNGIKHPITFPVRAGLAAESLPQMKSLISNVNDSTLTIWSSVGDPVNVNNLRELIFDLGLNKTYIDVPRELLQELHLDSAGYRIKGLGIISTLLLTLVAVFIAKKLY